MVWRKTMEGCQALSFSQRITEHRLTSFSTRAYNLRFRLHFASKSSLREEVKETEEGMKRDMWVSHSHISCFSFFFQTGTDRWLPLILLSLFLRLVPHKRYPNHFNLEVNWLGFKSFFNTKRAYRNKSYLHANWKGKKRERRQGKERSKTSKAYLATTFHDHILLATERVN